MSTVRESRIETYLINECKKINVLCFKFTSPSRRGVPDRLLIGRDANGAPVTVFVELKRPGSKLRPEQTAMITTMRNHGAQALMVDTPEAVDEVLAEFFTAPTCSPCERDPHLRELPTSKTNRPIITGL